MKLIFEDLADGDEPYWDRCPWCNGYREAGHQPDCPRLVAVQWLEENNGNTD